MKLSIFLLLALNATGSAASLAGLWEFNNPSDIGQATVGSALTVVGAAPTHHASLADDLSTSMSGAVSTVGGTANYLRMPNPVGANGGGSYTNEYSFLFDIFSPVASRSAWRALIQTNTGNTNDADYFIRNSNDTLGVGTTLGYSTAALPENQWVRLVLTFDINATGTASAVRAYVNGSLFHTHSFTGGLNGTYGLESSVLLFADNNNENASLNVNTVAFWDGALTPEEVAVLGTSGTAVPEPTALSLAAIGLGAAFCRRRRA